MIQILLFSFDQSSYNGIKMNNNYVITIVGFPGGSIGEESGCNAEDLGSIPGLGISPGGGHGHPLQYSCLENPHGPRSLAGLQRVGHD